MYCKNCGNEVKDGASFCENCGTKIEDAYTLKEEDYKVEDVEIVEKDEPAGCWKVFAKLSKILGIVAICISWIPFFGFIPGIPACVFSVLGQRALTEEANDQCKVGRILSIVASVITFVVYIVLVAAIANIGYDYDIYY